MRNKLAFRNARRSMKDYLVYLLTMAAVAALMFAFNSLIFSEDIQRMCSEAVVLTVMLGVVTFFIVLIVAWLINYMAKFMLEKRSREFAAYLLIGLKKKELSRLYMTENLLIGTAAFILGMAVGILLQQVIMTVFSVRSITCI
ncbi:MAG TPA: FtsX-like permease family protein [Candidatus Blautia faecavium]|uniref:FtsX-like permease family protein n=1 Tax=Candidatus Blautia faecavium TaxID=2838487 RepID=A0A9D2LRW9_9FIRM|nr:FtsX-like permease family protein [Candidatus Blautia faecavium]